MKVFFDERCLNNPELLPVLRSWKSVADFAMECSRGVSLFLDRHALMAGEFLQRLNKLRRDHRMLFLPMLFGSERFMDWRPLAIAVDTICRVATEEEPVVDCAICEVYGHRESVVTTALFGHVDSSFVGREFVGVNRIEPPAAELEVPCGTELRDLRRICGAWECLLVVYDVDLTRPPRDRETVLGQDQERFTRLGRYERNGRRQVYRESETQRLFYVDNLHFGAGAHLEVFDATEDHVGTADLNGTLNETARILGRKISW